MLLKEYYKILFFTFIAAFCIFYSIKNLGYFFDITSPPIKSDIIICLGGDDTRINKAIELFNAKYSTKNKLILTDNNDISIDIKLKILKQNGLKKDNIFSNSKTINTYQELNFLKNHMIKNNYNSVIIISSEPHSKRIKILIENFLKFSEKNISYIIVGADSVWWNKETYYKNTKAILFIIRESCKISYNYIFYKLDQIFKFNDESKLKLINYKNKIFKFLF